jgi:calcium/calmodulin-dependent protein kinase I
MITVLKVADFGLSKISIPNEILNDSCGTPAYVAPEVLAKKGYKKEVDMWSAGVIFYTLVCKKLPFQSQEQRRTFENI